MNLAAQLAMAQVIRQQRAQALGMPQNDSTRVNGQMPQQFPGYQGFGGNYTDSLPLPLKDKMWNDPRWQGYMERADKQDSRGMPNAPGLPWKPLQEMFDDAHKPYKGYL